MIRRNESLTTASSELQARVLSDYNFEWVDNPVSLFGLEAIFAQIRSTEQYVESGVAWETRQGSSKSDGPVSHFILTDRGLHFQVARTTLLARKKPVPTFVKSEDVYTAVSGQSCNEFLTLDFFGQDGKHLAGIEFHPIADPDGLSREQAQRVARALGVDIVDH